MYVAIQIVVLYADVWTPVKQEIMEFDIFNIINLQKLQENELIPQFLLCFVG